MKKVLSILMVLAMMCTSMAFVGCSSAVEGQSETPSSQAADNAAGDDAEAPSSEEATTELSGDLTLNGSTSMAKVCQALGEAFMAKYPDVTVTKSGNGSGDAPEAVNSGTALIGDLSRNLKDEEDPDQFEINQIAIDGIAIAVNKDNPVTELTSEQITQIFTGEITNWKDLGGNDQAITVIGREAASGTRDGFESIFGCEGNCKYAAEVTSTGEVVSKVGSDPSAIGYVSLDSVNDSITACKVDGVEATEENIIDGSYKAQRPFIQIYKKGSDSELIKAWFDFVYSDEGQQIISDVGLVPAQ